MTSHHRSDLFQQGKLSESNSEEVDNIYTPGGPLLTSFSAEMYGHNVLDNAVAGSEDDDADIVDKGFHQRSTELLCPTQVENRQHSQETEQLTLFNNLQLSSHLEEAAQDNFQRN